MTVRVRRVFVLAAIAIQVGMRTASGQAGEQQRPQAETERLLALAAQSEPSKREDLVIQLNKTGAVEPKFASFDAPFSLRNHFCEPQTDQKRCDAKIDKRSVKFVYKDPEDPKEPRATVAIRIAGESQPLIRPIGADQQEVTLQLSKLRTGAGTDRRVDVLLKVNGDPVSAVSLTFNAMPQLHAASFVKSDGDELLVVRLDRTGVATSSFLNPRWPIFVDPDANSGKRYLNFVNRLSDREFIVSFSGISRDNLAKFLDAQLHLSQCEADKCNAVLIVPAGGNRRVPLKLLKAAYVKDEATKAKVAKVVTFDVVLFHEETQLANPRGYFSLVQFERLEQAASGSAWSASVTGSYGFEPDLSDRRAKPDAAPIVTDLATRGGANDHFFKGNFSVGLKQSLGGRANSEMELRLKSGAYGTDASVKPTKYRLNVFGVQGNTYSAGLFTVAEPSEGIAISVTGENAGVHFGPLEINHIWRKYVPRLQETPLDFGGKAADGDHSATLLQLKSFKPFTRTHGQLDLFVLGGRKHTIRCEELTNQVCPAKTDLAASAHPDSLTLKQYYLTAGGELTVRPRQPGVAYVIAVFHSRLRLREGATDGYETAAHLPADNGKGTVMTGTGSWTRLDFTNPLDVKARFTIRGQVGFGSGSAKSDATNKGYIGETPSFAPDLLFLSVLAPTLQTERGFVGAGLSNKIYTSLLYTTSQYSPLHWIAKAIRIPSTDIDGQSMTVRLHDYRFVKWMPGVGRHAGTEIDAIFTLDSPSKVTYSLSAGFFKPGAAFKGGTPNLPNADQLIRRLQYTAVGKVTVKM